MAELKLISPLLSNMEVVKNISATGGSSVYIIKSTKTQQTYILKHISVPESQRQVDALLYTGAAATLEDAQKYYSQVAQDYQDELELLEKLADSPNLDCYRGYQIAPKEDEVGYDVYLLAEYRKTLLDYVAENAMTQLTAVNLGLDLCNALNDLRQAGLIHRDVKPSNIYLSNQGHFTLGDLGIARIDELKYCSMPEHMLSSYSAPELFSLVGTLEPTTDIYSTGLILYRIFNGNHGPFEDENTTARAADKLRVTGQELPAPMYADYEMTEIILKACAFDPAQRYQTPDEMKTALMEYVKRNQIQDTLIVPPIVADPEPIDQEALEEEETVEPVQFTDVEDLPEEFKENFSPDNDMLSAIIESVHRDLERDNTVTNPILNSLEEQEDSTPVYDEEVEEEYDSHPRPRRKKRSLVPLIVGLLVVTLLLAAAIYFFYVEPATITVDGIEVVSTNTAAIEIRVNSPEDTGAFDVVCSDAYGYSSKQQFVQDRTIIFNELVPGTQYTFTVQPREDQTIEGESTLMAATLSETSILSFTATQISVTQCELTLTVNGTEPETWTVRYYAPDATELTHTFTGHSTTIANLQPNTQYTFLLDDPEGTRLIGATQTTFSTVPSVRIEEVSAEVSNTAAIISWAVEGDLPENWEVTINGPEGYTETQLVTAPMVTFEGLTSGVEYEITVSTPAMLSDVYFTIVPAVTTLTDFVATPNDDGSYTLSWTCEIDPSINDWTLTYGLPGMEPVVVELVNQNSFTIPAGEIVPESQINVSLALTSGELLQGVPQEMTVSVPATRRFKQYGFDKAYIGLYPKPEGDDWGIPELKNGRTAYQVGEQMAYALESLTDLDASEASVDILLVIRDDNGQIVYYEGGSSPWNQIWVKRHTYGALNVPFASAGSYIFEVYFDRQYVIGQAFTVE